MNCIALIPARGGSKGIPLKNLQSVGGKSLLSRTIKSASFSKFINLVFVSSDSEEILLHAELNGALTIQRPNDLSNDKASTDGVIMHALSEIENKFKIKVDLFVLLQCTSTFTTTLEIDTVISTLNINANHDTAFAASECHSFLWDYDFSKNKTISINHDFPSPRKRRQDLSKKTYKELGSVYAIKVESLKKNKNRFGVNPLPVTVDSFNSFLEIDDFKDLEVARAIANRKIKKNISEELKQKISLIKLFVMDFDGVLTDNYVGTNSKGEEIVICSKLDSLGLSNLKKLKINLKILTSERNESVQMRARKLDINCIQTQSNKGEIILKIANKLNIKLENILYMGNDLNDFSARSSCSLFFSPNDAISEIHDISDYITEASGGQGAVREVCDLICKIKLKKEL